MKVFVAIALALPIVAARVSYDGYKAFCIDTGDTHQEVMDKLENIDFISLNCHGHREKLEVAIAPDSLSAFEATGIKATVVSEDLGADFAKEGEFEPYKPTVKSRSMIAALPNHSYFQSYHNFEQHLQFLEDLHAALPGNSKIFDAGHSVENRPIRGIHLWGSNGPGKNPAIIWHGTVHAREWIATPTVEYMTYQIIAGYRNNDPIVHRTLESHDIHVIPIVNPDGFVFTTVWDRLWRKNRQPHPDNWCVGTDINRNWPYQWDGPGSSQKVCDEDYRGHTPGDAPETRALMDHAMSISNSTGIKSYIDWHSFSQLILLPYGYSCSAKVKNLDTQMQIAGGVAQAIRGVNGLTFKHGPLCSTIYQAAGGSVDWMTDVADVDLAWGIELRPKSGNELSFLTLPKDIILSGEENWAGMKQLFSQL